MSGRRQTLVAEAPDGTRLELATAAGYKYAGLLRKRSGEWYIAIRGFSPDSVVKRTKTQFHHEGHRVTDRIVVSFNVKLPERTEIPAVVASYFASADELAMEVGPAGRVQFPQVTKVLLSWGWHTLPEPYWATRKIASWLKGQGIGNVVISAYGRDADFTVAELRRGADAPLLGGSLIGSRTR
jgi:hypothetical protein